MSAMLDETPSPQPVNRLLWIAAAAGAEAAVRLHIARGDYLEWRDKRGLTPLMVAASRDRAGVCRLLLEAGVDASALDASGRDALSIAQASGALIAAEAIAAWIHRVAATPVLDAPNVPHAPQSEFTPEPVATASVAEHNPASIKADLSAVSAEMPEILSEETTGPLRADVADASEQPYESSFGDWEPVAPTQAPPDRPELAQFEALRQRHIDRHTPIDGSAAWDDFEADLPEFSRPLPRADDAEFQLALRRLALLALREGSVPRISIEDLLSERGDAELRDIVAEQQLLVALGELGASADERLGHQVGDHSFKVFVDPAESAAEEREVDEALAFFEDLRSGRNDPLRMYLRSVANRPLLSAEREAMLARAMEAAVEHAIDSLSRWPAGLRQLLDSVAGAEASPAILWPIVATAREESDVELDPAEPTQPDALSSDDEPAPELVAEPVGSTAEALGALAAIREMEKLPASAPERSSRIREHLGALRFRRPFLARLADIVPDDLGADATDYRRAVSDLIANRDEMTRANLRLVYATAKRYLYTGVPLDDLIQEGNIGLIKAVDRFDWRRGFKFSTMAVWWIKQQIGRSIADSAFDIRPPSHVHEKVAKLRTMIEAFERERGRAPSTTERAAMLGISIQKLEILSRPSSVPMSIEEAEELGTFESDAPSDPMDVVADEEISRLISLEISKLKRKSEAIMRMRTGIGIHENWTLEQVGAALEVTRERIRQIEAKAMRTLSSVRSREELALATGRVIPKRTVFPPVEKEDAPEDSEEEGGEPNKAERRQRKVAPKLNGASERREITLNGDPMDPTALPSSIRRILDAARALGLDVAVESENGCAQILVAEVSQTDRHRRKLVRDMLQMGFIREPGKGYRR